MNVENLEFAFVNQLASSRGINPSGFLRSNTAGGSFLIKCIKCGFEKNIDERCKKCLAEYGKQWRFNNVEKNRQNHRKYHKNNREKINQRIKNWEIQNKERVIQRRKKWYLKNKDKKNKQTWKWRKNNPNRRRELSRRSGSKYRKTIRGKLNHRMSANIRQNLREKKAGRHWESLVGYTLEDLKKHLELQFKDGMSWDNMGKWHIDHKIPKSKFKYEKPEDEQFRLCWSLDNLQPLWAKDNWSKQTRTMAEWLASKSAI